MSACQGTFIELTDDGEHYTCPLPPDETIVEVRLIDGTVRHAWYSCNIMEPGDCDFLPVEIGEVEPDLNRESILDQISAWRPLVEVRAHKTMTPEEYAAMPIVGWHMVCRDYDGFGGTGVRFITNGVLDAESVSPTKEPSP